jgi:glycosyltransferase involved in cell wall biosynthesis
MKWLWLTLADPDPPENGQFLYSSGLIHGMAASREELHVVGLERPHGRHRRGQQTDGPIVWWLAEHKPRSKWACLLSRLPMIVFRTKTRELRRLVDKLCERDDWDAIVFDSITLGWALPRVMRRWRRTAHRPAIFHVSHNREAAVARRDAAVEKHPLKRYIKRFDAFKAGRMERALIDAADFVTSNSPDDCASFADEAPRREFAFLPPAYTGRHLSARTISADHPRRAVIVGSFDWPEKRRSLREFLEAAVPVFAEARIELDVVGSAEDSFLSELRQRFAAARFTGRVDDIVPYLAASRVALVPDRIGGFKLKGLDYVFNRVPILGIAGSVPGMPLRPGENILLFPDHRRLVAGVLDVIDDLDLLNRMQKSAYDACREQFDAVRLCARLRAAVPGHGRSQTATRSFGTTAAPAA